MGDTRAETGTVVGSQETHVTGETVSVKNIKGAMEKVGVFTDDVRVEVRPDNPTQESVTLNVKENTTSHKVEVFATGGGGPMDATKLKLAGINIDEVRKLGGSLKSDHPPLNAEQIKELGDIAVQASNYAKSHAPDPVPLR
jgi:hypothetical protein